MVTLTLPAFAMPSTVVVLSWSSLSSLPFDPVGNVPNSKTLKAPKVTCIIISCLKHLPSHDPSHCFSVSTFPLGGLGLGPVATLGT